MYRWCLRLLSCLILMTCCACSGRQATVPEAGNEPAAGSAPQAAGLPPLAELPAPYRDLSAVSADGFLELDPLRTLARANATESGGSLQLDNSAGVSTYALYGVGGFDGDNYPASVKLDVSPGNSFYLAFSDYHAGNWALSGPFNADGEFGIPHTGDYADPRAFTSPSRVHYFAVIVVAGSQAEINGVSLGVSGGDAAPFAIFSLNGSGSTNGFFLSWEPSRSAEDPDFAGYLVERAPRFSGDFTALAGGPSTETYFEDPSAVVGTLYRYRVRTLDFAGNSALSSEFSLGPLEGDEAQPVLVFDLPPGPLLGPADVELDLSGSFDPEGEGITVFKMTTYNPQGAIIAAPTSSISLQPGCHLIQCRIECADGRYATANYRVTVLPQWESSSQLLWPGSPFLGFSTPRLSDMKLGVQPGDGLTTVCGYDTTAYALTCWHQQGSQMRPYRAKRLESVMSIGESVAVGDSLLFPVAAPASYNIAAFDGSRLQLTQVAYNDGHNAVALVKDGSGMVWFVGSYLNGVDEKLFINPYGGSGSASDLATAVDPILYVDAVFEPASGHIFAFYDDGSALSFSEWDPATSAVVGGGALGVPSFSSVLDAEINPENGRIGVLFWHADRNQYLEQDGLGGWTLPVEIDNSGVNQPQADLTVADNGHLNACFALGPNQLHRYSLTAGTWTSVNTAIYSANSGYRLACCPVPGSADIRIADADADGVIHFVRLKAGNTENEFSSIDTSLGQGFDMHAAAGSDGLHLLFSNSNDSMLITHLLSSPGPDQGDIWVEKPSLTASSGLNLVSTSIGETFATGTLGPTSTLYYWDNAGNAFLSEQSFASGAGSRPMLGADFYASDVNFGVWDELGLVLHTTAGQHGSFSPPADWMLDEHPVWEGVFCDFSPADGFFCLAGTDQDKPLIGLIPDGGSSFNTMSGSLINGELSPFDKRSVAGRLVDEALFFDGRSLLLSPASELLVAAGTLYQPVRFSSQLFGGTTTETLPMFGLGFDFELRRSVCTEIVSGLTAVDLVASVDGEDVYFAWSNYGYWDELPLPAGLDGLSLPLIVCGNDGRWHIIYKNWKDDSIMIRSTV